MELYVNGEIVNSNGLLNHNAELESHNPDNGCLECCKNSSLMLNLLERNEIRMMKLDDLMNRLEPGNLADIPGPLGMIMRTLLKNT